jgi:hypothetical protein
MIARLACGSDRTGSRRRVGKCGPEIAKAGTRGPRRQNVRLTRARNGLSGRVVGALEAQAAVSPARGVKSRQRAGEAACGLDLSDHRAPVEG